MRENGNGAIQNIIVSVKIFIKENVRVQDMKENGNGAGTGGRGEEEEGGEV